MSRYVSNELLIYSIYLIHVMHLNISCNVRHQLYLLVCPILLLSFFSFFGLSTSWLILLQQLSCSSITLLIIFCFHLFYPSNDYAVMASHFSDLLLQRGVTKIVLIMYKMIRGLYPLEFSVCCAFRNFVFVFLLPRLCNGMCSMDYCL